MCVVGGLIKWWTLPQEGCIENYSFGGDLNMQEGSFSKGETICFLRGESTNFWFGVHQFGPRHAGVILSSYVVIKIYTYYFFLKKDIISVSYSFCCFGVIFRKKRGRNIFILYVKTGLSSLYYFNAQLFSNRSNIFSKIKQVYGYLHYLFLTI